MRAASLLALTLLACGNDLSASHDPGDGAGATGGTGTGGTSGVAAGAGNAGSGNAMSVGGASGSTAVGGTAGTSLAGGAAGVGTAGGSAGIGAAGDAGAIGSSGASGTSSSGGASGSSGAPGAGGTGGPDATCSIGVAGATPPALLALTGSLRTHDPAVLFADGQYYLFATGDDIGAKTSTDLLNWQDESDVWSGNTRPAWIATQVPAASNLWAADIAFFGGMYHLYYAASSFGSNHSCIGHATRASMNSGSWADQGAVICSNVGTNDNWNAIDPNVIVDQAGTPWMNFGSFWSGIKLIKLDMTGARADTQAPLAIADRPRNDGALEGPFIIWRCGYYYLFVSFDHCCDSPWNYNMRVGRATAVIGPYSDKDGVAMSDGGGTLLVQGDAVHTAPGHNAVILTPNGAYNIYHALNANHGGASLRIAELVWDADGWPISAGP